MSELRAVPVDPEADPRYDAYVRAHPRATRLPARRLGPDPARRATGSSRATSRSRTTPGELHGVLPLLYKKGLVSTHAFARCRCSRRAVRSPTRATQEVTLMRAARDTAVDAAAVVLAVLSPKDYARAAAGLRGRHAAAALGGARRRRPGRAAGRLAQDLQQPLPQPEEGRQGGLRVPRGNVQAATCAASTGSTCARCASTARCHAACASSS